MHHLGFWPDDLESSCQALERAGFAEVGTVALADGTKNVTYYQGPPWVGTLVELAPMTPVRRTYMGAIERLATGWDGSRPLRRFASRQAFIDSDDFKAVGEQDR
jgi:hypothetical protein